MQSTKSRPKSDAASDRPERDSVYDFLYYDADRVASFLGQFDPEGYLTGIKTNARSGGSSESNVSATASGGMPLVAAGGVTGQDKAGKLWERGAEKTFDPLWQNALAVLDYLTQQNLITSEMASAGIGQIVHIAGALSIIDMSTLKALIQAPVFRKMITSGQQPAAGPRQAKEKLVLGANPIDVGLGMVELFPHVVQARMAAGNASFWSSLSPTGLTVPPSDLLLKHGLKIAGRWNMLGVLDAVPDDITTGDPVISDEDLGSYIAAFAGMLPLMRPLLGRPSHAYGITPLLVFRKVQVDRSQDGSEMS